MKDYFKSPNRNRNRIKRLPKFRREAGIRVRSVKLNRFRPSYRELSRDEMGTRRFRRDRS